MKLQLKEIDYGGNLTLAQLWKAQKAQEKIGKSEHKEPKLKRKEAA